MPWRKRSAVREMKARKARHDIVATSRTEKISDPPRAMVGEEGSANICRRSGSTQTGQRILRLSSDERARRIMPEPLIKQPLAGGRSRAEVNKENLGLRTYGNRQSEDSGNRFAERGNSRTDWAASSGFWMRD